MIIDYNKLKRYKYRKSDNTFSYCHKCCGELEYCPIEKNVYCVRCDDCGTHTLIGFKWRVSTQKGWREWLELKKKRQYLKR